MYGCVKVWVRSGIGMQSKSAERQWIHHQTSGDLDDRKVLIYRCMDLYETCKHDRL